MNHLETGLQLAGMAELAWPEQKVAVFLPSQELDRVAFEQEGWRTCAPDEMAIAKALDLTS